jgi:hypothetical protein
MKIRSHILLLLALFLFAGNIFADEPPQWLLDAAKSSIPAYDVKDVPAVVLRNEESVNVSLDGTVTRTMRYAVKVLVREGKSEAVARIVYETDSEKVRDLNAWLIKRVGANKSYGKKEAIDVALVANDLYNEARARVINASTDSVEGDIFGFESVTEERNVFSQFQYYFQNDLPVISSRFNLNLPAGWRAESVTFNKPSVAPVVNGTSYSWALENLDPIKHEAGSPSWSSLSPRLAVSFFPAQASASQIKTFSNWSDVARWMSEIEDPQMTVDDALAAKAHDLADGAKTEIDKIRAIARYVQQVQYISIQIGTGKGGGYRPHSATDVFAKSYGDCKDKANLMRAMLSVLKIPAYMVSITADDPTYVRAEWASPHQFNHCIIAIKVGDATAVPSVVNHPKLGRLLMFDPTDPYTQVGDFPRDEQGSLALIDNINTDALLQMPVLSSDMNDLDRSIDATLADNGSISGTIVEKSRGQSAAMERGMSKNLSASEFNSTIEAWVAGGASGAKTTKISTTDQNGKFDLSVDFSAPGYAQIMQQRLMVFRPAIISRLEKLSFTDGKRVHPYMVEARTYKESVKIKLPAGFAVDEIPTAVQLDTDFGKYSAKYEVVGDELVFFRSLQLSRSTIPADKYDQIRKFFGRIHAAEESQVVLVKK